MYTYLTLTIDLCAFKMNTNERIHIRNCQNNTTTIFIYDGHKLNFPFSFKPFSFNINFNTSNNIHSIQ